MKKSRYIAIDIGAESGRLIVGTLENRKLSLEEIHRFPNYGINILGTLHWDIMSLYNNILKGIKEYVTHYGDEVDGIGIDTWGNDFGLIDKSGMLISNPVCYRDKRTEGILEKMREKMSFEELFKRTGLSVQPFYTLGQLFSMKLSNSPALDMADTFLMIPDILAYFLTGTKCTERSNAISGQLYNPHKECWDKDIFEAFDLPFSMMPKIVDSGTVLGELNDPLKQATGLKKAVVIAPCTHDTPSAVAAVPGKGDNWAFINSGTWSVLGGLTDKVITTDEVLKENFLTEITIDSFFLCQNIMGLWILQQSREIWKQRGEKYSYEQLVDLADQTAGNCPIINPNDMSFLAPADICRAIQDFCRKTGQNPPEGVSMTVNCILESLALSYRYGLEKLSGFLGKKFDVLHITGGGSLNILLCQFTADAAGIDVIAGPLEATVIGNILSQASTCQHIGSVSEIREIVLGSSELIEYKPRHHNKWQERYSSYLDLLSQTICRE